MPVLDAPKRNSDRPTLIHEQARALAVILEEEFGVPFVFYDAVTGELVWDAGSGQERGGSRQWAVGSKDREASSLPSAHCPPPTVSPAAHRPLPEDLLAELTATGRARVTRLGEGCYHATLLLWEGSRPALIAVGALTAVATSKETSRELVRLQKWLQAVSDRLRLSGDLVGRRRSEEDQQAQAAAAWQAMLTLDHLVRRMRIHKEPLHNQQRILEAALGLLGVDSLVWVPYGAESAAVILGEPCLANSDCRQLTVLLGQQKDFKSAEPYLCNEFTAIPGADRFPRVSTVLAFLIGDHDPIGWVLAINKREGKGRRDRRKSEHPVAEDAALRPFRSSDAALLTPFVGLMELHARTSSRYQDLKELLVGLTRSLTSALDAKDAYTYGHSERVARIALELGRELGMQGDELSDIYLAGLLHDVGKIGVRDAILSKVEPLTPEEFEHIKQHVITGYTILADLRPIRNLLPGVLYHHERVDGTGYPDGLTGEAIPLLARILAVADAYDAMSTTRPYRDALPCRKVEETLIGGAGTQWDRRVVEAFVRCRHRIHTIRQRGVGDSLQVAIEGALRMDRSSTLPSGLSDSQAPRRPRPKDLSEFV